MNENKIFPFKSDQLFKLREELDEAGSFIGLMIKKKAVTHKKGIDYVAVCKDIEMYRTKYLVGIYEPLHPFYDTEMPYVFWGEMYDVLIKAEAEDNI